jgi:hypothetical protein
LLEQHLLRGLVALRLGLRSATRKRNGHLEEAWRLMDSEEHFIALGGDVRDD